MPDPLQPVGGRLREESLTMPPPAYMSQAATQRARRPSLADLEARIAELEDHIELAVERAEKAEDIVRTALWTDQDVTLTDEQSRHLHWICR